MIVHDFPVTYGATFVGAVVVLVTGAGAGAGALVVAFVVALVAGALLAAVVGALVVARVALVAFVVPPPRAAGLVEAGAGAGATGAGAGTATLGVGVATVGVGVTVADGLAAMVSLLVMAGLIVGAVAGPVPALHPVRASARTATVAVMLVRWVMVGPSSGVYATG